MDVLTPLVEADQAAVRQPGTGYLGGWRIGLDPAGSDDLAHLRELADRHDASIARNLTKTVRFVATTTTSDSPMQAKARALGIPVASPQDAGRRLDEAIRAADLAALERREAPGPVGSRTHRTRPVLAPHMETCRGPVSGRLATRLLASRASCQTAGHSYCIEF